MKETGRQFVARACVRAFGSSAHEQYRTAKTEAEKKQVATDEADYLIAVVDQLSRSGNACMARAKEIQMRYWERRMHA